MRNVPPAPAVVALPGIVSPPGPYVAASVAAESRVIRFRQNWEAAHVWERKLALDQPVVGARQLNVVVSPGIALIENREAP